MSQYLILFFPLRCDTFLTYRCRVFEQVNVVCAKVNGEPVYEIHRPIAAHQELVVYYLAERPEELLFVHMRSTLYRRTMDSILEGKQIKSDIIPSQ